MTLSGQRPIVTVTAARRGQNFTLIHTSPRRDVDVFPSGNVLDFHGIFSLLLLVFPLLPNHGPRHVDLWPGRELGTADSPGVQPSRRRHVVLPRDERQGSVFPREGGLRATHESLQRGRVDVATLLPQVTMPIFG